MNVRFYNEYGLIEVIVGCVVYEVLYLFGGIGFVLIGRLFEGVNLKLEVLVENGVSELLIGGESLLNGYINFLEMDVFCVEGGECFYVIGDLVNWSDNGKDLYFCGRKGEDWKVNGYRVDLLEIELMICWVFWVSDFVFVFIVYD